MPAAIPEVRVTLNKRRSMWTRTGQYLVNFEHDGSGYHILATDLHKTFAERLSNPEIEARGEELGLEFALSTAPQVSAFLAVLARLIQTSANIAPVGESALSISVEARDMGADVRWVFKAAEVSDAESKSAVAKFATSLFGVIERLGHEIARRDQNIADKNEVIAGMHDALMRHVDYRPPRHLEPAFENLETETIRTWDALDLANRFWPAESSSIPEPRSAVDTQGSARNAHTDTHADTHEDTHEDKHADTHTETHKDMPTDMPTDTHTDAHADTPMDVDSDATVDEFASDDTETQETQETSRDSE